MKIIMIRLMNIYEYEHFDTKYYERNKSRNKSFCKYLTNMCDFKSKWFVMEIRNDSPYEHDEQIWKIPTKSF